MVTSLQKSSVSQDVSQWMDGEAEQADLDAMLASLKSEAGRGAWEIYHQIGDVLRDGEHCAVVSPGFQSRFSAALAEEATVIAPQAASAMEAKRDADRDADTRPHYRAWALAATVVGAVAVGWGALSSHNAGVAPVQTAQRSEGNVTLVAAKEEDRQVFNPTPSTFSLVPVEKRQNATVPADYLAIHQEYVPSTTIWSGVNAYQRVDGLWGHDFSRGQ